MEQRRYEQPRNPNPDLNYDFAAGLRALRSEGHLLYTRAEMVENAAHNGTGIARDLDRLNDLALDFIKQIDALRQFS